ncbi:HAD family hydrolase [uncultured Thomasclavelia sp.]|uniref:HAD family hydrolase n=1 Tax=uncultured Thomasclavelia sp. TaxID=3025759 RepID=UPI0026007CC2|nr:HAD family hydrolase [uncultured Thomasclavelia sp.]
MKNKYLFFTDLDKTLLNDSHQISLENFQAIKKLQTNNMIVVLASGRSYQDIKKNILDKYQLKLPVIALNGAQIYNENEQLLKNNVLNNIDLKRFFDICNKQDCFYLLYDQNNTYYHQVTNLIKNLYSLAQIKSNEIDTILMGMQIYYNIIYSHHRLDPQLKRQFITYNHDLFKIEVISHDQKFLNQLKSNFTGNLKMTASSDINLEITSNEATKGNGVIFLSQYYDIEIKNTFAIGDNYNDLEMLQTVNYKIAVKNAEKKIKQLADYVSDSYDLNGFAKAAVKVLQIINKI